MTTRIHAKYGPLAATALVLVALYVGGCVKFGDRGFATLRSAKDLLGDNAFLGAAAIGATFVILSGGIDLSVGSVVAFTSILVAMLIEKGRVSPGLAMAIALACGASLGAGMGCLIHFFRLPPFLVTLGGMFFARGMGFMICPQPPAEPSVSIRHPFYARTLYEDLAIPLTDKVALPFSVACVAVLFLIALYVLHFTRFGRNAYAVGGDESSAALMGLPVGATKILVYSVAGLCSAAAGILYTFQLGSGDPTATIGLELDAIASVVIGGSLLSGGVGYLAGTLMGVLILGLILSLINMQGTLSAPWTKITVGALLLLFILLQNFVLTASRRRGKKR